MEEKYGNNTSVMGYYFKSMLRYWRKSIKMMFFYERSEWSEITVDELFERFNSNQPPLIIDNRTPQEFADGHIPNARLIPITKLKANFDDLKSFKEKEIVTLCPGGGLSLVAVDILVDGGFKDVKSLKGGMDLWMEKGYPVTTAEDATNTPENAESVIQGTQSLNEKYSGEIHHTLDARNFSCPVPVMRSRKALKKLKIDQILEILTTDPGSWRDIPAWARVSGQELIVSEELGPEGFRFLVRKLK